MSGSQNSGAKRRHIAEGAEARGIIIPLAVVFDGVARIRLALASRRFPYTVVYLVESSGEILIVSVFHQSRNPLAWRRNL